MKTATASNVRNVETHSSMSAKADSVFIYKKDSVFIMVRGDSVLIDRWHTLYKYAGRTDTLHLRDSIYANRDVVTSKTVEVNRLTSWQNFQVWCGRALLLILFLYIVYMAAKRYLKTGLK